MLDGFVPFPEDFAQRYRDRGYWQDRSLADEFSAVFQRFASPTALIAVSYTHLRAHET